MVISVKKVETRNEMISIEKRETSQECDVRLRHRRVLSGADECWCAPFIIAIPLQSKQLKC
jgi:hypothetical protein